MKNPDAMEAEKPKITPKTKVGELLDAFPQLEELLLSLSPAFAKLKNPVLRKTIARVATLQQAALVGGLNTDVVINQLRLAAGMVADESHASGPGEPEVVPAWYHADQISFTFNATALINAGESPMSEILALARKLRPGGILAIETPFYPAPIADLLREKGFGVYTRSEAEKITTCVYRPVT